MTDLMGPAASAWEAAARQFEPAPVSPYLQDPVGWCQNRLGEHLWSKQREIAESVRDNRRTAVKSCHNAGKGLPLDTLLPTPTGWTTMGEVQPGDELLDEAGLPCKVEATTPVWNEPCYLVKFSNGEEVVTDAGHLWSTVRLDERHNLRERRRQRGLSAPSDWRNHWEIARTLSTPEIAATLKTGIGQLRHAVPVCAPLDLPDASLPIDPYVLGAWLGDGTSTSPEITCDPADREIVDRIATLGENVRRRESSPFAWTMAGDCGDRPRLRHRLTALGVLGSKNIPMLYLRASREQRIELLRGIMDTDGFNARNSVGVDLCSERLANDVAELVRSLGCIVHVKPGRATCNGVDAGIRYRMAWRSPFNPFRLARKRAAWVSGNVSRRTIRTISSVEAIPSVPTKCIQVSSPSRLYLATAHFIPTHNSWIASRIASWWIDTHPPGQAFVASTAPTYPQVHAILWEEVRAAARKAAALNDPLPGRVLQSDEWKLDDGILTGYGRKPADTDEHGFQGIHRRYVLVILDEACGIPAQLWTAVEAITTNADCRILAIGNPDDPSTEFASVCKPGSGWNVIRISGLETPNFTADQVDANPDLRDLFDQLGLAPTTEFVPDGLRPLMLDPEWVADKIKRWGAGSPRFISKVLGEFPDIGNDVLISPALIRTAQERALDATGTGILGVDVARYGMDRTVIYLRRGPVIRLHGEWSKQATTDTTGRVIEASKATGADEIRVDGVGVGGGVVDQLTEQGYGALDMQAGAAAQDRERFVNARSEWAWAMRERLEDGDLDLDPADEDLAAELGSLKYRYNSRGQIVIESKDEMRKRGLPSPDHADAAILTAINPVGADLFRRLAWRHWTLEDGRLNTAGRTWAMNEAWIFLTSHLPTGDDAVGDFSVVSAWARTLDGYLVLLDRARWKTENGGLTEQVRPLADRWQPDTMFILKKQRTEPVLAALYPVVSTTPLEVDPDPMTRILPASAMQAAGKVWLPNAVWAQAAKSEFLAWPHTRHSGTVETLAQAVRVVSTQFIPPPGQPTPRSAHRSETDPWGGREIDIATTEF